MCGCLLSGSSWSCRWNLSFSLLSPSSTGTEPGTEHKAWPAVPCPHHSPGARRHQPPTPCQGTWWAGALLEQGQAKRGHVTLRLWQVRGKATRIPAEGRDPPNTLARHWNGCSAGTAACPDSCLSPWGAKMCLQTPGASRQQLTHLPCPAGWSQGGRRLKLLPEAHPSPCHPLISWTSLWDEPQGMTPASDPTSKVRGKTGGFQTWQIHAYGCPNPGALGQDPDPHPSVPTPSPEPQLLLPALCARFA